MRSAQSQEARAFRSVKRICYAGLDSITLRSEVGSRLSKVVPSDAWTMATVDPDTALFTHSLSTGVPADLAGAWVRQLYPLEEAAAIIRQSRARDPVTTASASMTTDLLRAAGFPHEMRTVLATRTDLWGFCCLLRGSGTAEFRTVEKRFMRRIAPHVAAGLRAAALLDASDAVGTAAGDSYERGLSGVLVLDGSGGVHLRNDPAVEYLQDLADTGVVADGVPSAVAGAVVKLRVQHARDARDGAESEPLSSQLRVRGRSGCWYTLEASLSEPGASGDSSVIVLVRPARRAEVAQILTRLYGLTPRERETLARVARGQSTKEIATALGISTWTVQEYIGKACEKAGVRSRKALIAKVFLDGYAADAAANAVHD
jgi:DNA-binding CsgD family transcriptional regulator